MPVRPSRLVVLLAVLTCGLVLTSCTSSRPADPAPDASAAEASADEESAKEAEAPATFSVARSTFSELPGWKSARPAPAMQAFARSCTAFRNRPDDAPMVDGRPAFGTVRDWIPACMRVRSLTARGDTSNADARQFFARFFTPHRVGMGSDRSGLFTGYFEPELQGARDSSARYSEPLRRPPDDLVKVPVRQFLPDVRETIFGRVEGNTLVPYPTRETINDSNLDTSDVLVWVDSRIDKFFLQIQGSGRVRLDGGGVMRVGYAAQNGQPYRAIGRDLIQMGEIAREDISLQSIRQWLRAHPGRADSVMNLNRSYIFFRELNVDVSLGPLGAQGVPLTPERSLAVDARFLPYGAPLWLVTRRPDVSTLPIEGGDMDNGRLPVPADTSTVPMRRLMIAQDTGGAIRGAVRGDVFWGSGPTARAVAGRMKSTGTYLVLLPNTLRGRTALP